MECGLKASASFKGSLNYDYLRIEHGSYLRKLNDALLETALAIEGMKKVLKEVSANLSRGETSYTIQVPNKRAKLIPIKRSLTALQTTLSENSAPSAYVRSIVFLISLTEDYLATSLKRLLCAYPQKLLISPKGKVLGATEQYSVDVREIIAASSLDAVIEKLAVQRVSSALYASPQVYLSYFDAVCGIKFEETTWNAYVEIKATRDILVHSDGLVNNIYIEKTGQRARFGLGEKIVVDAAYFDSAASCMKALLAEIYTGLRGKFANSAELKRIIEMGASSSKTV